MADNPLNFSSLYQNKSATPTEVQPTQQPADSGGALNFGSLYQQQPAANTPSVSLPTSGGGGGLNFGSLYGKPQEPEEERDESDRFTQDDPGANWLEKAWSFSNKPLTESLFGWGKYREGAGGVERFFEKTASDFTSPLSLITLALFAPAGVAEGVAGGALKEGLIEGEEFLGGKALDAAEAAMKVENYGKAVQAAEKAKVAGQSIEGAISNATNGQMPYQEFLNFGQYLKNQGMSETDVLAEGLARRGISKGLVQAGVMDPGKALKVAKGVELAVNAGFTYQAVQGAMYAYPRALDEFQNGNYDKGIENILDAGANTVFGALGLAHSIHSFKDIAPGINEERNLALSDESEMVKNLVRARDGHIGTAQSNIQNWQKASQAEMLDSLGIPVPEKLKTLTDEDKWRWDKEVVSAWNELIVNKEKREALRDKQMEMFFRLDSGNDPRLAYQQGQALSWAAGRDDLWKALVPEDIQYKRTLADIGNEEAKNLLDSQTKYNASAKKIDVLNNEIKALEGALKKEEDPVQKEAMEKSIQYKHYQLANEELDLPKLKEEFDRNKKWDELREENEQTQTAIGALRQSMTKLQPDDVQGRADIEKQITKLQDDVAEKYKDLYAEKHADLLDKYREAAKGIQPRYPKDTNALNEWNNKLRAMANNPEDLLLIEDKFPELAKNRSEGLFSPAEAAIAPETYEQYYKERLHNPELIDRATLVTVPPTGDSPYGASVLAIPVGGERTAGMLDTVIHPEDRGYAELIVRDLKEANEANGKYAEEDLERAKKALADFKEGAEVPIAELRGDSSIKEQLNYLKTWVDESQKHYDEVQKGYVPYPNPRIADLGRNSLTVEWGDEVDRQYNPTARIRQQLVHDLFMTDRQHREAEKYLNDNETQYKADRAKYDKLWEDAAKVTRRYNELLNDTSANKKELAEVAKDYGEARSKAAEFRSESILPRYEATKVTYDNLTEDLIRNNRKIKDIDEGGLSPEDTHRERAKYFGQMYGYKPEAVNDYLDQAKNYLSRKTPEPWLQQTETKRFKQWFGNSKVVDQDGNPLVVFHGTNQDWHVFDPWIAAKGQQFGLHAGSLTQAERFAPEGQSSAHLKPLFLSIQNPLRTNDLGRWPPERMIKVFEEKGLTDRNPAVSESERKNTRYASDNARHVEEWNGLSQARKNMEVYAAREVRKQGFDPTEISNYNADPAWRAYNKAMNDYAIKMLEDNGYDGIVYKNEIEGEKSQHPTKFSEQPTSGDSYIALHGYQIKSAIGNTGDFGYSDDIIAAPPIVKIEPNKTSLEKLAEKSEDWRKRYEDNKKRFNSLMDKIREADRINNETPEEKAELDKIDAEHSKLFQEQKRLSAQAETLKKYDIGQVKQLPDGTKITYLTKNGYQQMIKFLGRKKVWGGELLSAGQVHELKNALDAKDWPFRDEINKIVNAGTNKNGTLIVSVKETSGSTLSRKLDTLREEINHSWQLGLGGTTFNHLRPADYKTMHEAIPRWMKAYLNKSGYRGFGEQSHVIETASKLLSADPIRHAFTDSERNILNNLRKVKEEGGTLSGENEKFLNQLEARALKAKAEARDWITKYFEAVEKKHGDKALDNLVHTTTLARKWKEEYIKNARPESEPEPARPDSGADRGNVERLEEQGGEGSGGSSGPPPSEPPQPPEPPDPDWWRDGIRQSSGFAMEPWQTSALHPQLPQDFAQQVKAAKDKSFNPKQIEYVDRVLKALATIAKGPGDERTQKLYRTLRHMDDDNWTVGYNNGIIKSIVDDHIHHIWERQHGRGYPVVEHAMTGAFSINASQAKHRTWSNAVEGILKGYQLAVHDPISIIGHDASTLARNAANRKVVDALTSSRKVFDSLTGKKFNLPKEDSPKLMYDPEGMPIFVAYGRGAEIPGVDGQPSAQMVNPNVVRRIEMEPHEVARLQRAKLLETYIKDGRVVDRTPQVDQGSVGEWIKNTKDKINEMIDRNPLVADRKRQVAAWEKLQEFSRQQAQLISEYLQKKLDEVDQNNSFGVSDDRKRFSMAKTHEKALHRTTSQITPKDRIRLENYLERNQNYAQGLTGDGSMKMTPADVAKIVRQEREFLPEELKSFLDEHHDLFSRDKDGNVVRDAGDTWTRKGLSTAMWHTAHAAENPEYEQLTKDLADLQYVDKNLTSANPITQEMHKEEALQRLKDINDRQKKLYFWSPKSHIVPDNPAFHGWKWMGSINGKPVLAESDIGISRHYYRYLVNALGMEKSRLRTPEGLGKITAPILKASSQAKSIILSGSPFHIIQEALRGLMLHVNPFVRPNPVGNLDIDYNTARGNLPVMKLGVYNGLTLFQNRAEAEDWSIGVAGHGGIVAKIPVYGKIADQIHDFLFNRYIPSLKASGFRNMFDRYAKAHPDWTNDAVARAAADHTNSAFGGINWRQMGRSATTQDWFHLVALAPDWLESEMRFAGGLFKNLGIGPLKNDPNSGRNFTREQVAQTAAVLWVTARVLNSLYSGSPHYETPFGLATKDKDGREIEFSVRTMPTDILHMASDPMGFLNGRMSPFLRTEEEFRTGRNQFGQKLTPGEKYVDMLSNLIPIGGQQVIKEVSGLSTSADVPGYAQVARAAGATTQVYRTPAQKTAAKVAAERSEEGSMTPAKIHRHRLLLQLEDDMRAQRINMNDLEQMVAYGNLPIADAKAVMKNVEETAGQNPEMARLYSRVSRMDFQGALAVWDDANESEKKVLEKVIRKKAASYIKKSVTDFTPDERAKDPIFKRARQIAPILETTPAS